MSRVFTLAAVLFAAAPLHAQPATVVYQGFLAEADGTYTDGLVDMFFRVYTTETGGTPAWTHTEADVPVVRGAFSVELPLGGSGISGDDLWLAIAVESQSDELSPRQRLASVPWALLCGDADRLGGQDPSSYQALVAGCPDGSSVRRVYPAGLVDCEVDDAMGVTSVTAGPGLAQDAATGDLTVDLDAGSGIQIVGDSARLIFGGPGLLDETARADHDHAGLYVPLGSTLSCGGTDKVIAIDPVTGDVQCGPDQNTPYGVVPGGNLMLLGNVLDTASVITTAAPVSAGEFRFSNRETGYVTRHPTDFDPSDSSNPDYYADWAVPGQLQSLTDTTVLARLDLPDGAAITEVEFVYRSSEDTEFLCCGVRYLNVFSVDPFDDPLETHFETDCSVNTFGALGTSTHSIPSGLYPAMDVVDNASFAYQAECFFQDGSTPGDLHLVSYRVTYTYDRL